MSRWMSVSAVVVLLGAGVACAQKSPDKEDAASAHARGRKLLAAGDLEGASQAFIAASTAGRGEPRYRQEYTELRTMLRMRKSLAREYDLDRWLHMARILQDYYHDYRVYSEALPIDHEIHLRQADAKSATLLAETQLALGSAAEALEAN